jgi:amino acid permease
MIAAGLLAGTIIGAGIFSLPYVFAHVGLVAGAIFLVGFTLVYFFIHRMYADLALTESGRHQFVSLAKRFLPKPLAAAASISILAELLFVLAVYLILVPSFAELAVPGSGSLALIAFWVLGSLCMFLRLEWLG